MADDCLWWTPDLASEVRHAHPWSWNRSHILRHTHTTASEKSCHSGYRGASIRGHLPEEVLDVIVIQLQELLVSLGIGLERDQCLLNGRPHSLAEFFHFWFVQVHRVQQGCACDTHALQHMLEEEGERSVSTSRANRAFSGEQRDNH